MNELRNQVVESYKGNLASQLGKHSDSTRLYQAQQTRGPSGLRAYIERN